MMKQIRISNPELLKEFRKMLCIACARQGSDAHHLKTKKTGGHDLPHNLMPLCRICHSSVHLIGLMKFAEKYKSVENWLFANGWYVCLVARKYRHE